MQQQGFDGEDPGNMYPFHDSLNYHHLATLLGESFTTNSSCYESTVDRHTLPPYMP